MEDNTKPSTLEPTVLDSDSDIEEMISEFANEENSKDIVHLSDTEDEMDSLLNEFADAQSDSESEKKKFEAKVILSSDDDDQMEDLLEEFREGDVTETSSPLKERNNMIKSSNQNGNTSLIIRDSDNRNGVIYEDAIEIAMSDDSNDKLDDFSISNESLSESPSKVQELNDNSSKHQHINACDIKREKFESSPEDELIITTLGSTSDQSCKNGTVVDTFQKESKKHDELNSNLEKNNGCSALIIKSEFKENLCEQKAEYLHKKLSSIVKISNIASVQHSENKDLTEVSESISAEDSNNISGSCSVPDLMSKTNADKAIVIDENTKSHEETTKVETECQSDKSEKNSSSSILLNILQPQSESNHSMPYVSQKSCDDFQNNLENMSDVEPVKDVNVKSDLAVHIDSTDEDEIIDVEALSPEPQDGSLQIVSDGVVPSSPLNSSSEEVVKEVIEFLKAKCSEKLKSEIASSGAAISSVEASSGLLGDAGDMACQEISSENMEGNQISEKQSSDIVKEILAEMLNTLEGKTQCSGGELPLTDIQENKLEASPSKVNEDNIFPEKCSSPIQASESKVEEPEKNSKNDEDDEITFIEFRKRKLVTEGDKIHKKMKSDGGDQNIAISTLSNEKSDETGVSKEVSELKIPFTELQKLAKLRLKVEFYGSNEIVASKTDLNKLGSHIFQEILKEKYGDMYEAMKVLKELKDKMNHYSTVVFNDHRSQHKEQGNTQRMQFRNVNYAKPYTRTVAVNVRIIKTTTPGPTYETLKNMATTPAHTNEVSFKNMTTTPVHANEASLKNMTTTPARTNEASLKNMTTTPAHTNEASLKNDSATKSIVKPLEVPKPQAPINAPAPARFIRPPSAVPRPEAASNSSLQRGKLNAPQAYAPIRPNIRHVVATSVPTRIPPPNIIQSGNRMIPYLPNPSKEISRTAASSISLPKPENATNQIAGNPKDGVVPPGMATGLIPQGSQVILPLNKFLQMLPHQRGNGSVFLPPQARLVTSSFQPQNLITYVLPPQDSRQLPSTSQSQIRQSLPLQLPPAVTMANAVRKPLCPVKPMTSNQFYSVQQGTRVTIQSSQNGLFTATAVPNHGSLISTQSGTLSVRPSFSGNRPTTSVLQAQPVQPPVNHLNSVNSSSKTPESSKQVSVGAKNATVPSSAQKLPYPPLPETPHYSDCIEKPLPPKPLVKAQRKDDGKSIFLSWDMPPAKKHAPVAKYQIYSCQLKSENGTQGWKKTGDVESLVLPMACTLRQFESGTIYYFIVRTIDVHTRFGPFSDPVSVNFY